MAKIDFAKVEETLGNAIQSMFITKISIGIPVVSKRAALFYQLDKWPKPKPVDPVIEALIEMAKEREMEEALQASKDLQELAHPGITAELSETAEISPTIAPDISIVDAAKAVGAPTASETVSPPRDVESPEEPAERPISPFLLLQQHLEWLVKKRSKSILAKMGTSREELETLKNSKELTEKELSRIHELLEKAKALKKEWIEARGMAEDDSLIEMQRKSHVHKRFNVKESWLPLD